MNSASARLKRHLVVVTASNISIIIAAINVRSGRAAAALAGEYAADVWADDGEGDVAPGIEGILEALRASGAEFDTPSASAYAIAYVAANEAYVDNRRESKAEK